MSSNTCNRIVLAGAHGCRVLYCEECKVAEVEMGALSLRLEMQAFNSLGGNDAGSDAALGHHEYSE
jgi:hypothetical protein